MSMENNQIIDSVNVNRNEQLSKVNIPNDAQIKNAKKYTRTTHK
jgi:hypothetical protein